MRKMALGILGVLVLAFAAQSQAVGTGTLDQTSNWYAAGSVLTVNAEPGVNSEFGGWLGDTNGATITDTQIVFTVDAPHSITGVFSHIMWDVYASVGTGSGTITPSGTNWVAQSSNQTFTITPATYYHIDSLVIDGGAPIAATNSYAFSNVTTSHTIVANFALDEYTVKYLAGANGSISGVATQTVTHGSNGTAVSAVANTGYEFVDWSDGSTANPRTDSNVTSNMTLTASFAAQKFTFTVASAHGTPNPTGVTTSAYNTVVNAWMTDSPVELSGTTQYVCTGWIGTGSLGNGTTTNASFTITNNTTLTWQWSTNYWVEFNVTGN